MLHYTEHIFQHSGIPDIHPLFFDTFQRFLVHKLQIDNPLDYFAPFFHNVSIFSYNQTGTTSELCAPFKSTRTRANKKRVKTTMKKHPTKGLVYSTDHGTMCAKCGNTKKQCSCTKHPQPPSDGIVRISRQTKGRKGSGVCLISGLPLDEKDLKALAKKLKRKCGSGGTITHGVIEIQGDHRELLFDLLTKQGYKTKLAGG